jgi:hypothetical protein
LLPDTKCGTMAAGDAWVGFQWKPRCLSIGLSLVGAYL